jgi:hypothetical protein
MLGVASEAAWVQLAHAILARGENPKLRKLLDGTESASADRIVAQALKLLEARSIATDHDLRILREREAFYRDLRNHAVHAPEAIFEEARFTRTATGLQIEAAPDYFRRLYAVLDKLS